MVATRREDGLFDVPGLGFPIPREYVPAQHLPAEEELYNQDAVAPPAGPDQRTAQAYDQMNPGQQAVAQDEWNQIRQAHNNNKLKQAIDDASVWETSEHRARRMAPAQAADFTPAPPAEVTVGGIVRDALRPVVQAVRGVTDPLGAQMPPPATAPIAAQKAPSLEPGPGEHPAGGAAAQGRTPMDEAYAAQLLRAGRGSPGVVTPGGDRLTGQQWSATDEAVNPDARRSFQVATDPETGEPVQQLIEGHPAQALYGRGQEPVSAAVRNAMMPGYEPGTHPDALTAARHMVPLSTHVTGLSPEVPDRTVPKIVKGEEEFANRQAAQQQSEAHAHEQEQGALRRDARHEQNMGNMLQANADQEKADIAKAQAQAEQQQAQRDHIEATLQHVINDMPNMARSMPVPKDTRSHFILGIAQGLMQAGHLLAGQNASHINLIQDAINTDLKREEMAMNYGMAQTHAKLGALNTLAHLNGTLGDPVAAAHALVALRYQQAQHELQAMTTKGHGSQMSSEAAQLNEQLEVAKQHNQKMAIGAVRQKQWNTVAPQYTPGRPGGIEGINRYIDSLHYDPKTTKALKDQAQLQIAEGKQPTFKLDAAAAGGAMTRTDERLSEYVNKNAVRLPAWMDQRQPIVFTRSEPEGQFARKVVGVGQLAEKELGVAEDIVKRAGGKMIPTLKTQLAMALNSYMDTVRQANGDGTLKIAELPFLEKMTGASAIGDITSLSEAQTIINRAKEMTRSAVSSRLGDSQVTMTPGGTDFWKPGGSPQKGSFIKKYGGVPEGADMGENPE